MLNDNELSGLNNQSHNLPGSPKARLFDTFKSEQNMIQNASNNVLLMDP
jgi:hypothetical protein